MSLAKPTMNYLELTAVIITAAGKFILIDWLGLKFWFVSIACALWLGYVLYRFKTDPGVAIKWGFRKNGFVASWKSLAPLAIVALAAFVGYGVWSGSALINWHLLPILILYPIWGTIQHFLLIGLFSDNLPTLFPRITKTQIVILTALLFSAIHFPNVVLMAATGLLALVYTLTYLKHRNLWVLGIFHGWLAGLFYYLVMGRDAWLEFLRAVTLNNT